MATKPRIAIVVSHPIQHFCPMYESLALDDAWEIMVFFASKAGLEGYFDPHFGKKIAWEGLNLDGFPHRFLNGGAAPEPSTALDAPELGRELDAFDPDVVFLYGYSQRLQQRAFFWALRHRKKIFHVSDAEVHSKHPLWKQWLKQLPLRLYYQNIDAFLTVGNANEGYYYRYGAPTKKLFRAGFPIHIRQFEPIYQEREAKGAALRAEYGIAADAFVCGVVGKLVPWKSQAHLIRALKRLEQRGSHGVVALIVGSGPDQESLRSEAQSLRSNRAVLTGFVKPSKLPDVYAACDVYVQTSQRDRHALSISEAIYMGKPLIITEHCGSYGSTDDLQVGKNGFVYPHGDIEALADRIEQLLERPELVEDFGAHSRQFAVLSQRYAHGEGLRAALRAHHFCV